MSYIGVQPGVGQYRKLDDISGSFNGSTTTFTTSVAGENVTAISPQQLIVSVGGVIQQPVTDYTTSTNSIIFSTAPGSGLDFFAVLMGDALNIGTPSDGSVTTAKLGADLTVDLASGTAAAPSLTFDSNTGLFSPGADEVAISTGGTQRATVDSSGYLRLAGAGIQFNGDTAAANSLDDYEEGTWTPVLGASSGGSTHTQILQQGSYIKIGKQVTLFFAVGISTAGSPGTGIASVLGMPFTADTSSEAHGAVGYAVNFTSGFIPVTLRIVGADADNAIRLCRYDETTNLATLGVGRIINDASVYGTITYLSA